MHRHGRAPGFGLHQLGVVVMVMLGVTPAAHAQEATEATVSAKLDGSAAERGKDSPEPSAEVAFYSATSLFGRMTRVRVGPDAETGLGGGFWFSTTYYGTQVVALHRIGAAVRSRFDVGLGAGNQGIEGALDLELMGGHRLALATHHGPLLRYGFRGLLEGNRIFYTSRLELPALALGYQYWLGTWVVELSARGSAVLVGRYAVGDAPSRRLGNALGWGGQGAVFWHAVGFEISALRIELEAPVHVLEARLCSGALALLVCSSLASHVAEIGDAHSSATVAMITVGAAQFGRSGR